MRQIFEVLIGLLADLGLSWKPKSLWLTISPQNHSTKQHHNQPASIFESRRYTVIMMKFVALLRAVNVGGTGKLPMAELRSMAEEIGLLDVQTYIQSGNLVFSSDDTPANVKTALEQRLQEYAGKPVGVILRSAQEMQNVLDANPFPSAEPSKVGVLFLDFPPPPDTKEAAKGQADEEIELGTREVFVHYPSGMGRTKLKFAAMADGTVRNINTVTKLAKMAAAV